MIILYNMIFPRLQGLDDSQNSEDVLEVRQSHYILKEDYMKFYLLNDGCVI